MQNFLWGQVPMRLFFILLLGFLSLYADAVTIDQGFEKKLTKDEKAFLLSHPVLIMGIDRDFPPYEWIDSKGNYVGLTADYISLVKKLLGVKIKIVKDKSWAQVLEMAKEGKIDIISDAVKTPQRENYLNFTKPFISTPMVIVDNGQNGYLDTLERLKGKKVAVEKGYFVSELILRDHPQINQLLVGNVHEALKAVLNEEADAYVGDAGLVSHIIRSSNLLSLRISGQTDYVSRHSIAVTKEHPLLVSILNKALDSIPLSQRKEITYNWFNLNIKNGIELKTVAKYAFAVLVLILVMLYWNWRLRKEIKKREKLEKSLQLERDRFALAVEGAQDGLWDWNLKTNELFLSERFETMLGYKPGELKCDIAALIDLIHPDDKEAAKKVVKKYLQTKGKGVYENNFRLRSKDGSWCPVVGRGKAQFDENGAPIRFVGFNTDISHQLEYQQKLDHTSKHDLLTNLPNRFYLSELLTHAMFSVKRSHRSLALLFIDLDGFKEINDSYGRKAGDAVLSAVSARMSKIARNNDIVSRIGGDEFVVVLNNLSSTSEVISILQNLLSELSMSVEYDKKEMKVSASIGVSFYPQEEDIGNESLLRQADQAMYHAKLSGKNQYQFFNIEASKELKEQQQKVSDLRHAIKNDQLVLHYQPKVDMSQNRVVGFEALLRWEHPEKGLVYPDEFLPLVENESSFMVELGHWVLEQSFSQVELWHKQGLEVSLSMNVSSHDVQQQDFAKYIKGLLDKYPNIRPNTIEIELLETSAFENFEVTSNILKQCQELGISIAIDDFGTGYASLQYLKNLPMNTIKIDKSFVIELLNSKSNLSIVEASIGLAHTFGCSVVAEGVESEEHGRVLLELGCKIAQGYVIAKAMPSEETIEWARSWQGFDSWRSF